MTCVMNAQTHGPSPNLTVNTANNRVTDTGYAYDAAGNVTNDGFHTYTWDADANMRTVDSTSVTFDALDRPVEKAVGTTYTQFVYSPMGGKLALMNGQTLSKAFVPLPGGGGASSSGPPGQNPPSGIPPGCTVDNEGTISCPGAGFPWWPLFGLGGLAALPNGGQVASNPGLSPCGQQILSAVNQNFGTNFQPSDIFSSFNFHNTLNLIFQVSGLASGPYAPARYALSGGFSGFLGLSNSLHIAGNGFWDPRAINGPVPGNPSVFDFTAHLDSAYPSFLTPLGALVHFIADVLGWPIFHTPGGCPDL